MKLVYRIMISLIIPLILTLGLWGWLSYRTMENKIHSDSDLILKNYSDDIIMRFLSGNELPERFNGVYNTYLIEYISQQEAETEPIVEYSEAEVALRNAEDFASSRVRKQIFVDNDGNYLRLTVSLPTFEQELLIEHVLSWTIILFVVLFTTLIIIAIFLLNYNMRPFFQLLDWIDRYQLGMATDKIPSNTDIIEFQRLASAVEGAVQRIENQYEEKKIFIGNASHELQTPLAVCSNRIEVLLERSDLDEDMAEELVKIHRSLGSLIKLNKTLLLLSKIENGQFLPEKDVDMTDLIKENIQLHKEMYEHKDLKVHYNESGRFIARVDDQMGSVLICNLIKNAFSYTQSGQEIKMSVFSDGFSISNTGVESLDRSKVFRTFYQPLGRREGSTGLGLALVNSVCTHNNLEINYDFREGMHVFSVNLNK